MDLKRKLGRPASRLLVTPEWWARVLFRDDRFPDFLGIGVPKAGTTWLHNNLRHHPDLFLPEKKELHFFDQRWHKPIGAYLAAFEEATGASKGEITPSYCTLPEGRIRWIHRLNPQLRLILMLRNPADQVWSYLKMKSSPDSLVKSTVSQVLSFVSSEPVRLRTDHALIARKWLVVFPREQLFVARFEQISDDPQGLLRDIFKFLGVEPPSDWSSFPMRTRFLEGKGPALREDLRPALRSYFGESVRETQDLLKIDLGDWLS